MGIKLWQVLRSEACPVEISCFCPYVSTKTAVLLRYPCQMILLIDKLIRFFSHLLLLSMKG